MTTRTQSAARPLRRALMASLAATALLAEPARSQSATAQSAAPQSQPAARPTPAARPADVTSVDAIIAALYESISGPAGQKRDWDRLRSLFAPGARLIPSGRRADGTHFMRVLDVEQYITNAGPMLERDGFFEAEIARRTERFGGFVHALSTYETRRALAEPKPFMRGINSIQLVHDGTRWWVMTVLWEAERADNPIPARFLESGQ